MHRLRPAPPLERMVEMDPMGLKVLNKEPYEVKMSVLWF